MEAGAIMTILTQHGGDKKAAVRHSQPGSWLPLCKPSSWASACMRLASWNTNVLICWLDWLQGKAIAQLKTLPQMLLPSTFPLVKQLVKTSRRIQVHNTAEHARLLQLYAMCVFLGDKIFV